MLAVLLALLLGATPAYAAPGDLDPTFGTNGVVRIGELYPVGAFEVGDGLTVIGRDADETSGRVGVRVEHVEAGGTVAWRRHDPTAPPLEEAAAGADGSIAAFSTGIDFGSGLLVRYTASGERDRAFGSDGAVALDFEPQGVVVQDDGRIIVAGPDVRSMQVARYTADGRPDPSFAGDGRFEVLGLGSLFFLGGIALDRDGKLLLVGGDTDLEVLRLTTGGEPDRTFSGDGVAAPVRWIHPSPVRDTTWITPLPDGYLIGGPRQFVRVTRDGELDLDYVSDVNGSMDFRPGVDGRTVVHTPWYGRKSRFQRLNPDGSLDPEFGVRDHDVDPDATLPLRDGSTLLYGRLGGRTELRRLLGGGAPPPPVRAVVTEFPDRNVPEGHTGSSVAEVTFGLAKAWPQDVSLRVVSQDGAATAGEDYTAVDEVVTIPAGELRATVRVTILGDGVYESGDDFALIATPVTPNVRVVAYGKGSVRILQDEGDVDPTPTPTVTPMPTATPTPTETPAPTATPTPSAPTPDATPTATPLPGPTPGPEPAPSPEPAPAPLPAPFADPSPPPLPRTDFAGALEALTLPALSARNGTVTFTVRPPAALDGSALTFTLRSRGRKPVVYGRGTVKAATGPRRVTLRLNAAARRARALRADMVITANGAIRTVAASVKRR